VKLHSQNYRNPFCRIRSRVRVVAGAIRDSGDIRVTGINPAVQPGGKVVLLYIKFLSPHNATIRSQKHRTSAARFRPSYSYLLILLASKFIRCGLTRHRVREREREREREVEGGRESEPRRISFQRACDISFGGWAEECGIGFESGLREGGATRRAIYDIYLWTRLRDRNPEEVKVGFVTYFSPTWKYLST